MAKTSKGVILSQASQIKSDYSFALIKATADNKSLVQDASSAELKVNALVEYSKDSQWDPKKLTNLGFPAGCFLIVDLRGQDIHAADLITNLALVRQYGYQAGVIDDLSTLDDIKALKANQIYLINSGKTNDDQDASLNGNEITDGSGKLAVGMSVKWQRDYTNVDVSGDHAGFVGMGQDTLLKGGNAFGYSTNGRDFNAVITPKGLIFRRPDAERMWRLLKPNEIADINSTVGDKVKKEVDSATAEIPAAVSAANSAVSAAESAIAASKVNSDAIVAQSEAISEAKSAMDSATAEIQQTAANAASDAAKIRADVARVQNEVDTAKSANSASVEALKSDINTAKQDLADVHDSLTKAQSAVEQNQKLINDSVAKITSDVSATKQDLATVHDSLTKAQATAEQNQKAINDSIAEINANVDATNQDLAGVRKDLTKAQSDITANQKAVNDNVAQINSNIEQDRKDIASAQQANANTAKQLDTYSKQAQEQGRTIKAVQDKQDGFSITLADVQGNVAQVSDKVDGLSASLKDAQGNVASVKAQADQLSATLTDHGKAIATLTASAKELSSTLEDADGRLSKVEQTAQTNSSTLSDVQGDLSQVKQDATALTSTLKDTQGNISTLQQKADSVSAQLASAQGDIATLQTGVDSVKATLASHDNSIHTLQLDSKSLKDSMADAQGGISTLSKTATSLDSEMKDHAGRLSKVEQSAATQATTLSDLQGNLTQVKQQADGLVTTLKDAQGDITQIQQKADDTLEQLKSAQGDIASLQTDVTGIKATLVSHEGDIHTLQADSKALKDDMADAQGNISSLQKSSTKLDSEMSSQDGRLSKVEQTAKEHTTTISDLGDKLSNMKVGGRNLLHGTSDQWRTLTGEAWLYQTTATDMYTSVADYHGGDQFTYSATITNLSTVPVRLVLYCYGADKKPPHLQEVMGPTINPNAGAVPTQVTITMDANTWFICSDIETLDGKAPSFSIKVKEEKLEKGNVATAWTPNPEDMATLTQVKQTADGIETTLKSAQGDIDQIKQTAKGTSEQLADVQGNVTNIQKDIDGLKQTTTDNVGNIHTLQSDSKSLHDSMQDVQGNISTLQKTSTDVTSELQDHAGRISKVEQTASTLTNEFSDQDGRLSKVEQTATGTQQTVANQQGQINSIQTDVSGIHETITGQGNQIATINVTLNGLSSKYEGVEKSGDELKNRLDNLSIGTRNLLHDTSDQYRTLAGSGRLEKSTASNIYTSVANYHGGDYFTYAATITNSSTKNAMLEVCLLDGNKNPLSDSGEAYPVLIHSDSVAPGIGNTRKSVTFEITDDTWFIRTYLVFDGGDAPAGSQISVKDERLVEGSMAGTWSPNPADVADKITTNSTQIDQNKKAITLKADQTTVDNLSGEVSQNKTQLKVQAGQISSKVTATDVNNIVDGKGYATTSTVQSLITQKAGTINENIVKLDQTVKQGAENNVQLVRKSDFADGKGSWTVQGIASATNPAPPAELGQTGMNVLQTNTRDAYEDGIWYSVKPGEKFDVDFWCAPSPVYASSLGLEFVDKDKKNPSWRGVSTKLHGPWEHITGTITAPANASFAMPWFNMDKPADNTGNSAWLAKPSIRRQNATTVAAIQQITASIDGIQSTVANKADKSQVTQLSNVIQSKVSTDDFNNLRKAVDLQTLDSADINNMKTNGHYFVHNLTNSPIAGWVYVDVTGNGADRIRQDVYQDNGNQHKYRRWFGDSWTAWSQGATESEITQLRDDINLRVKSGDLLSQINLTAHNTLIQSGKIYLDSSSTVFSGKAFIPSAAIVNLDAAKIESGFLHTDKVAIGDNSIRLNVANNEMTFSGSSVNKYYQLSLQGNSIAFRMSGSQGYDYRIAHGVQKYETDEDGLDFDVNQKKGSNNNTVLGLSPSGVMVSPSLFFQTNNIDSPVWMGFTRNIKDGAGTVEFHTSDDEGERFRVDCGARFEKYLYINGYARAQGWLNNSTLSKKTNIAELDTKTALNTIRRDKQYTYEYRQNVERGENDPQASFIIDDVNAVSQYTPPKEFLDRTGKYREPAVELSYLVAAVQELDSQVQKQAKLIKELKEKANE